MFFDIGSVRKLAFLFVLFFRFISLITRVTVCLIVIVTFRRVTAIKNTNLYSASKSYAERTLFVRSDSDGP